MSSVKLQTRGVHVFEKAAQGGFRLTRVNPYLRLQRDASVLFIQGGRVYSEDGPAIAEASLPAWFKEEVEKASKAALRECGWSVKG